MFQVMNVMSRGGYHRRRGRHGVEMEDEVVVITTIMNQ